MDNWLGRYTLHDLRRSCITNWASHLPIHVTKQLAGHADVRTTEKYYLAVRDEDIAQAQQVQAELLGELTGPNLTDAKVTQTALKQHFPGKRGCQPKRKAPD